MARELNTILLKGINHHEEVVADAAVSPGEAIEIAADGKADPVQSAQAEALKGSLFIAKEDALQGKTVDDAYVQNDILFYYIPVPGDHVNALVKSGEDIDLRDLLVVEGGGSGLFVEAAGTETKYQLQALEDSDGALGANTLIKCVVL